MQIRYFANYRTITGRRTEEVAAPATMLALLEQLSTRYGAELRRWLLSADGLAKGENAVILLNGRHIEHLDGVATTLKEEDVVSLFPLVAGG
ncbi:MAG: MoaD family protein [Coriobacteriia bacterium]|nr:MoaD family protein [Coriobacteriia bacterium]